MTSKLRSQVRRRAHGRCEYCQTPFSYDSIPAEIDHIIAAQHGGRTVLANLAAACAHCNSHKGPNISGIDPVTRKLVRLFHPRKDRWNAHCRWSGALLVGASAEARATIRVLALNDPLKTAARAALMEEDLFRSE